MGEEKKKVMLNKSISRVHNVDLLTQIVITTLMQRPLFFPPQQVFDLVPLALYYQYNVSTCLFINCLPMNPNFAKTQKSKFQ